MILLRPTDQNDFVEQLPGRPVDDGVDGPEQGGPGLVVEDDDDAGVGQRGRIRLGLAPGGGKEKRRQVLKTKPSKFGNQNNL